MKERRVRTARGARGSLLRSIDAEGHVRYFLRIYEADSFRDYALLHSDLEIEITDEEAMLYEDENPRLDHSPKTLGTG